MNGDVKIFCGGCKQKEQQILMLVRELQDKDRAMEVYAEIMSDQRMEMYDLKSQLNKKEAADTFASAAPSVQGAGDTPLAMGKEETKSTPENVHPNIVFVISGYTEDCPEETKLRYLPCCTLAHVPHITGVKYTINNLPGWTKEEEREQSYCGFCHPKSNIREGDYTVGQKFKNPI